MSVRKFGALLTERLGRIGSFFRSENLLNLLCIAEAIVALAAGIMIAENPQIYEGTDLWTVYALIWTLLSLIWIVNALMRTEK